MVLPSSSDPSIIRFGTFELDLRSGELRKSGVRVALQEQPFRVLARLLARPGDLVTREELRQQLWPSDTFVDFEHGLNAALKRLRDTLGDSAENPRFIETVPRRGYRFVAPVAPTHPIRESPARVGWWRSHPPKWPTWWMGLTTTALVAALAAWSLLARNNTTPDISGSRSEAPLPVYTQLTFRRGMLGGARFASEGQAVVYSDAREGTALQVWRLDLADSLASRSLDFPAGSDVLAARVGELALSVRRRFVLGERFVGTLAVAPIGGGSPHEVAENIEDADWDPSGAQLAIARSSGDVGGQSQIEYPVGHVLYKTAGSIRFLRVSRDGRRIAFLEDPVGRGVSGRVSVVDLDGRFTSLTEEWAVVRGLAWSARGDEIWFTAGESLANRALRAVNLEQKQRLVLEAPGSLTLWDIAPDGRVLLTRDEERRAVVGVSPGETLERDLSWSDKSGVADLSEDGRWLLFGDRFGVGLRATDGSPPIYLLKDGFADDLSPDGKTVLATTQSGRQLVLVSTGARDTTRPLPSHGIATYQGARWFPDGRRILFSGREPGRDLRSYIQDVKNGAPRALTPENTRALSISPDGAWAVAIGPGQAISLWPVAGGPPRPVHGSQAGDRPVAWSADGRSLWLFRRSEVPAHVFQLDIATGRRRLWKTLVPPDAAGIYSIIDFQITPTGHAYFYSYTRLLSQLYLVRGLK